MDWILEQASKLDIAQLIAIGAIVWFVLRPIKQDIKEMKDALHAIDKRVCVLEGMLMNKDCCLLKDNHQSRKAE